MFRRIILSDNFSVRACDSHFYLCDLARPLFIYRPYELTEMQYKFINLLTGRYTLSDILSFYPKKLHNNILKFLKELQSINAISYSYGKVRNFPTPSKNTHLMEVHFELTKKCNLCCQHCYQEKCFQSTQQDLTLPEIANLIAQLENLNVIKASISGGETLKNSK
jgi:sulfatase maturation enzyme AslB (radical SAM superfamily)